MKQKHKIAIFILLIQFTGLLVQAKNSKFDDVVSVSCASDSAIYEKPWALVTLSVSNMRANPDDTAELVSQATMGTPMKIVEDSGNWCKVQTPENYIGWMDVKGFQRLNNSQLEQWKKSNRYFFNQVTGNAFNSPSRKRTVISDLVLGDIFEVDAELKGFLKVHFPDNRTGFVKKSDCLSWKKWTSQKPDANALISVASEMLGIPYLWGGTSSKAFDCSGFTKIVYFSQGIILARDASKQALYGDHPDFTRHENLQPGDLLFFGSSAKHVTHVGIYLGNEEYLNASGYVRINSLDPKDPRYKLTEKKGFVAASRILNSPDTDGIVLVKNHPWYSIINQK